MLALYRKDRTVTLDNISSHADSESLCGTAGRRPGVPQ
jgi:hypothetical protein